MIIQLPPDFDLLLFASQLLGFVLPFISLAFLISSGFSIVKIIKRIF